ncbi:LPXTG cell wall anchor domain-containing protein [Lentzea sp. BCCO 10_0061]|uniref:LPXTG cell wall anchor domain-containing protein n=1 Tax=Lentzea sokolovensis TaxID=3095429 RepID=A0ABU4UPG0_9PSEU|nr:LPXTG cell wall anchor domain-containing protein [Lentzea sp. BCCO 10_0061]MDX8141032.1 LPXTG cell wall anchor domain-containing protein [Lentzea sp. BCCO 10_0061]
MARRVLGAFAVTATAALATLALSTPASAHTPRWTASCDEGAKVTKVSVNLTQYNKKAKNTVTVLDGQTKLPIEKPEFQESFSKEWNNLDASVKHVFKLVVTASDGYNYEDTKTVEPCVKKAPPTTTTTTTTATKPATTTPEVPSSSEVPPSTTPAAPGGSAPEPPLAATGASPMWLLLSGLGLVGAGAGTLLFLRRRSA